jgi:hypothetical protein
MPTQGIHKMNVKLQGARSQARLDWDTIELQNQKSQALPRRVFFAVLIGFALYLGWTYLAA